jgi:SAM-dependent methyltransferase
MDSLESERSVIRRSAGNLYGRGQVIWFKDDRWNRHKRKRIEQFILGTTSLREEIRTALDVGSGNSLYAWMPTDVVSADFYHGQVAGKRRAVVCDLEMLPFRDDSFELVFCIGSVLNYVSALEALHELSRVTRTGGRLFLHFETSSSFEQFGRSSWNAPIRFSNTLNSSRLDHIWIYSPAFIYGALKAARFQIIKRDRFHILSALLTRVGISQNRAAWAAMLDRLFSWLGLFADDVIVLAEKI